jgi:hypothetical protein
MKKLSPEKFAVQQYLKQERYFQIQHIREQATYDEFVAEHYSYDQVSLSELVEVWVPA